MDLFPSKSPGPNRPSTKRAGLSWSILSLPLAGLLLLPLIALLIETSPIEIWTNLKTPAAGAAIWVSIRTSLIATFLTVLLGTPLAILLAKKQFAGRQILDALIDLPMVLPPAVAGVALLLAFGRRGLIGEPLGLEIPFTMLAVILAQIFVAGPLYIRAAIIGLASVEEDLEDAAVIDGAGTWQLLRYVTFPLTRNALIGGAALTWARALGEFGATIIFAGNLIGQTQTMPLAIFIGFEQDLSVAIALAVLLMAVSFVVMLVTRYLMA